ncbi:MAG: nucleotidyl transferase AbiEii/AbiGii toxin family protein [Patescibacteria group bacterium]
MNNHILLVLKKKLDELRAYGEIDAETQRNALKEDLQFYVLNFIYQHPKYSDWTMYGGSALRICHGLDRMSVDLDFEVTHPITEVFLNELKKEIGEYFKNTYGSGSELLTIKITAGRGLTLRFHIGDELGVNHPSRQVHVKIDLNYFTAPKTVIERWPVNRGQLSFVIKTYNLSALMASKIAAILLRGARGVGDAIYLEKGRDIYDLLWYLGKKIVPDLDYLTAKKINVKNLRTIFDLVTLKISKVNDANLKQDLTPLFLNKLYIEHWLTNWRESYSRLLDIHTVTSIDEIIILEDLMTDVVWFKYTYHTKEGKTVLINYKLSDYCLTHKEGDLGTPIDEKIMSAAQFLTNGTSGRSSQKNKLKQYATLFYQKTEDYFKKTNHTMLGREIATKLVRMTADNLNQNEEILLNARALQSYELEDLLK